MSGPDDSPQPIQINGVAHVILRVNRVAECIAFYDRLMPFLGLSAIPPRSDDFVYYVGGRTALAIRRAEPEHAGVPHIEAAAGLDHLCFRGPLPRGRRRGPRLPGRARSPHRPPPRAVPLTDAEPVGAPGLTVLGEASSRMVTGPSFTSSTSIRAPNAPRFAPRRSQKRSYSGSATSPGAAST